GIVGKLAGGWQLNGTYFIASGQRFTPVQTFNTFFLGIGYNDPTYDGNFLGADTSRPFVGNLKVPGTLVGISQIDAFLAGLIAKVTDPNGLISLTQLNQNGNIVTVTRDQVRYIVNGPGAARILGTPFGNASRGSEIGPMLNNLNLGIVKNFKVRE